MFLVYATISRRDENKLIPIVVADTWHQALEKSFEYEKTRITLTCDYCDCVCNDLIRYDAQNYFCGNCDCDSEFEKPTNQLTYYTIPKTEEEFRQLRQVNTFIWGEKANWVFTDRYNMESLHITPIEHYK